MVKALSNVCFLVHVCSSNTVLLLGTQPVEEKEVFHLGQKHWSRSFPTFNVHSKPVSVWMQCSADL